MESINLTPTKYPQPCLAGENIWSLRRHALNLKNDLDITANWEARPLNDKPCVMYEGGLGQNSRIEFWQRFLQSMNKHIWQKLSSLLPDLWEWFMNGLYLYFHYLAKTSTSTQIFIPFSAWLVPMEPKAGRRKSFAHRSPWHTPGPFTCSVPTQQTHNLDWNLHPCWTHK